MAEIWEGVILAMACSLDAFAASFAYGGKRMRIPWLSGLLVTLICTAFLGGSLWLGDWVRQFLPSWLTVTVCFGILLILGFLKLWDGVKNKSPDPEKADKNGDMIISPLEAALLAVGLSLDGLAVGFGAGVGSVNILAAVVASAVIGLAAVTGGCRLGGKLARALPFNLSWASGVILIGMAVLKLF